MKRISLVLMVAVVSFVGGRLCDAQQVLDATLPPQNLPTTPRVAYNPPVLATEAKPAPDDVVGQLVAILNDTKSPKAYLVTLGTLMILRENGSMKSANLAQVLPAVIRNAERLQLFKGTPDEGPNEMHEEIMHCLQTLIGGKGENGGKCVPPPSLETVPAPPRVSYRG